jgi:tripartite-type tricarboxylate transporter receptor subunit TctC
MSGEVDVVFANYAETLGHVKAGKLRALGVSSSKRAPTLPDVPTIAEAGLPGYEFTTWHGILAPKATPRPIVALLNDRMKKSLMTPDQVKRFQDHGLDIVAGTPEEFAAFIAAEYKKWGRVIKERGMRAE